MKTGIINPEAISARVFNARQALELTQLQFAERCDISVSHLAAIENGIRGIGIKTLCKLCDATSHSSDHFLFGKDDEQAITAEVTPATASEIVINANPCILDLTSFDIPTRAFLIKLAQELQTLK